MDSETSTREVAAADSASTGACCDCVATVPWSETPVVEEFRFEVVDSTPNSEEMPEKEKTGVVGRQCPVFVAHCGAIRCPRRDAIG